MEVNVRTQKAFVRGYYTVKVSYTIVPWKKENGAEISLSWIA